VNVSRFTVGPLDTNCWLVHDGVGGPVVVIDPAGDAEELLAAVAGRDVSAIVLTHGHFDHLGAAGELVAATGAPLLVHVADAPRVTDPMGTGGALFGFDDVAPEPDRLLVDGDVVEAGGLDLRVMHTPGHTEGSISLYAAGEGGARREGAASREVATAGDALGEPGELFSGDTLFAGSVGRTDFAGGDARALRGSLAKLAPLPDETRVHPGHGPDTTIGREKRVNPFWPRA
jgi:hydroxyacylglutathione hydrolase